jgi:toxin ParE1/3/4
MKIIWSPLAITRINEIADYISDDNPKAALEWIDEIFDKVKRIDKFPLSGRFVPEIDRKDIRELIFGNYRIIYRIFKKDLFILTVRHFKQKLPITDIKM